MQIDHGGSYGATVEAAEAVTQQLAEQDQQRDQPSGQRRDSKGRFSSSATAAPTSWSEQAKAEWSKLSPELQQAVLKREDEISRGSQQHSDERERLRSLENIIAPRRGYLQQAGFKSDAEAIN